MYTHSNYPGMHFFSIKALQEFLRATKEVKDIEHSLFRRIMYNTNI